MDLFTIENMMALVTLTALEIVLGIDNVVFIAILVAKLPESQRDLARRLGLGLAMFTRIALLLLISWIMLLTTPVVTLFGQSFSGRDIILLIGGLFLIVKATQEIHDKIDHTDEHHHSERKMAKKFYSVIFQIIVIDIVFSLDSVITAVGMSNSVPVMIAAIVIAVFVMMLFSKKISDFIEKHPTFKMLALTFLLMIGVMLVAEGFGRHIERGYIYFGMAFSFLVEILNMKAARKVGNAALVSGSED